MSGCMLTSLILGGMGFVGLLVCCGVGFWIASTMAPKSTTDPKEVLESARKIIDIELPLDFSPDKSLTMDNMMFDFRIAEFKHKEGKGEMFLTSMRIKIGDPNQASQQSQPLRNDSENRLRGSLDIKKTESHDVTIHGKPVSVAIGEGTDRTSGKSVHTASTDFTHAGQLTIVMLRMDDEIWDQDAVLKMFENAK